MKLGLIIFILAFTVRFINLFFLDLDLQTYLIEDQKLYWEWALKDAYLPWGGISLSLLTERMPGAFFLFELLQRLTDQNLFLVLVFQSIIDSLTCVIIFYCAGLINKKYQLYTGLFACFSPLMIILSSQILSDTIFLFTFSCCLFFLLKFIYKNDSKYSLYLSGLFLGVSTFIRVATFPLIFLSIPIIFLVIRSHRSSNKKIFISLIFFILIALIPVSYRWVNNIIYNDTYALTSQSGSHVAYWMVPGVLTLSKNLDRKLSVDLVNKKIHENGGLTDSPYKDSKIMLDVSRDILSKESILYISYAWFRSSVLNIIASPILIDIRVRGFTHASFAEEGNIIKWMKSIIANKDSLIYLSILMLASILSLFSGVAFIIGYYIFFKSNFNLSIISIFIIMFFCFITGPTISPKYCLPYIPIIFYLQAISIHKLFTLIKKRKYI
ncbi:glycosyltransferase family 39 protein [Alphaproteobacteria bacterium]|nr:glycosyltransferase family 39 protein [Alphaproteobacteria bacterium]